MHLSLIPLLSLLSLAVSAPATAAAPAPAWQKLLTSASILSIAPNSGTCIGAPFPSECRTSAFAATAFSPSFAHFNTTARGEIAALLALTAYETADYKYQKNHFPGRPGQGTRNMQMAGYNLQYALSFPQLESKVQGITNGAAVGSLSAAQLNEVLNLTMLVDDYDFGSASWFLATQCSEGVRTALQLADTADVAEAAWTDYLTECVGTTVTSDRGAYFTRALAAMQIN